MSTGSGSIREAPWRPRVASECVPGLAHCLSLVAEGETGLCGAVRPPPQATPQRGGRGEGDGLRPLPGPTPQGDGETPPQAETPPRGAWRRLPTSQWVTAGKCVRSPVRSSPSLSPPSVQSEAPTAHTPFPQEPPRGLGPSPHLPPHRPAHGHAAFPERGFRHSLKRESSRRRRSRRLAPARRFSRVRTSDGEITTS